MHQNYKWVQESTKFWLKPETFILKLRLLHRTWTALATVDSRSVKKWIRIQNKNLIERLDNFWTLNCKQSAQTRHITDQKIIESS